MHAIVDAACGPGGWVLDTAFAYPMTQVIGIDISRKMVEYARAQAWSQRLNNADFQIMDVLQPLNFPDNTFDLVNARFLASLVPTSAWPTLVQEYVRVACPGGIIRLTEADSIGVTNSTACEKLSSMHTQALRLSGLGLSPDGRSFGVTPMLARLLRDAGCVNIQQAPFIIDYSVGAEAHEGASDNYMVAFQLLKPFLLKMKVTNEKEFEQLYHQMLIDFYSDDFCGYGFILSVWGEKPRP